MNNNAHLKYIFLSTCNVFFFHFWNLDVVYTCIAHQYLGIERTSGILGGCILDGVRVWLSFCSTKHTNLAPFGWLAVRYNDCLFQPHCATSQWHSIGGCILIQSPSNWFSQRVLNWQTFWVVCSLLLNTSSYVVSPSNHDNNDAFTRFFLACYLLQTKKRISDPHHCALRAEACIIKPLYHIACKIIVTPLVFTCPFRSYTRF